MFNQGDTMPKLIRRLVHGGLVAGALLTGSAGLAGAADPADTTQVLEKLHQSDQKEIAAGKLAIKNGQSKEVQAYGKMLVKDHGDADKKVAALAKQKKVDLAASTPAADHSMNMEAGASFDAKFAAEMLDDHKKDIAEVSEARDKTDDAKLKKLLSDLLPTLQKHQDAAQKILDAQIKK
jgi:putative membrane protein